MHYSSLQKFFKMNIAVLGAGMVGRVMALDLAKEHSVTSVDVMKIIFSWCKIKMPL